MAGDDATGLQSKVPFIDSDSMLQGQQLMIINGMTDFIVTGTAAAKYLILDINARDRFRLNNALSVGQRKDGRFFTADVQSAINDIADGKQTIGIQSLMVPDVNGDGFNSPSDALSVINYLNQGRTAPDGAGKIFLEPEDVNGDGVVTPIDAMLVINALNDSARDAAFAAYDS